MRTECGATWIGIGWREWWLIDTYIFDNGREPTLKEIV